jgi:bifunctional DNase/RNase
LHTSYTSSRECINGLNARERRLRSDSTVLTTRSTATSLNVTDRLKASFSTTYKCLPDSLDPRAPKAKWNRWLAFYLPMNEANRLARAKGCPCAPVFDLVEQLVSELDARIDHVELSGDDHGIWAALDLERESGRLVLGGHPVDGMALALRAGAPILAADTAMTHARALDGPPSHDEVRCWLDGVERGDFAAGVPLDPPAPTD